MLSGVGNPSENKERFSPRRVAEVTGQAGMTNFKYLIDGLIV